MKLSWAASVRVTRPKPTANYYLTAYPPHAKNAISVFGLVHTCRQNPRLSIDKLPILSVDCCGTNLTWSGTFCHASTHATCLWTIAELCLYTQVCDFVYECVPSLSITHVLLDLLRFTQTRLDSQLATYLPQIFAPEKEAIAALSHLIVVPTLTL